MARVERYRLVRDENKPASEAWRGVSEVLITRNGCVIDREAVGMIGGVHKFRFKTEQEARDAMATMLALRCADGFTSSIKF